MVKVITLIKQTLPITNMKFTELAIKSLHEKLVELEKRVEYLEDENIGLSNELYELQNRLDILHEPKWEHLNQFSLGDS
jgi:uncharacterized membrane protein